MMGLFLTAFSIFLLATNVSSVSIKNLLFGSKTHISKPTVLSEQIETPIPPEIPPPPPSPKASENNNSIVHVQIKNGQVETKITPPPATTPPNDLLSNLHYPNSSTINSGGSTALLESSDSPDAVTNWYKDKLKALNYGVNSFVVNQSGNSTITINGQTVKNTGGKVLNSLVSSNGQTEVRVNISQESSSSKVQINITVTSK